MKTILHPSALWVVVFVAANLHAFGHSANEPAPRPEQGWQDRQKTLNKRAEEAGEKAQVIFIGDSITQGWEGEGKEIWARYYSPRNAVNLGIGGDRTQHVLWRLDNGNLNGLKPKAAVLMIGTNNSNGEDNSPGQIVDGVTALVQKLRDKLPQTKILLLAIFPRGENYSAQRGKLAMINQALRKLADEKNVFWIDFGHEFLNSDGTIPRQLMPDYLHLSARGYAIWAEAIEGKLAGIIGDEGVKSNRAGGNVSGDWLLTIEGPEGKPVTLAMILKQDGDKLSGRIARGSGSDGWLEIENGQIDGPQLNWTIKRERSTGGTMTYRISGKYEAGKLTGLAKADRDGEEVSRAWTAERK